MSIEQDLYNAQKEVEKHAYTIEIPNPDADGKKYLAALAALSELERKAGLEHDLSNDQIETAKIELAEEPGVFSRFWAWMKGGDLTVDPATIDPTTDVAP